MTDLDLDLDALKAAALAATPGPWHSCGGYLTVRDPDGQSFGMSIYHLDEMGQRSSMAQFQAVPFAREQDARYIAAANPATILALVERVRRLEADLETSDRALIRADRACDFACRECRPDSPALVNGFVCAYHKAAKRLAALDGKDKETTNGN